MGMFYLNNLPKGKRIQMIGEFYDVVNSLKNRKEVRAFLKDLLTGDEIASLMRRIEVAILLSSGFTYEQIAQLLNVGKPKITNVQKALIKEGNGYKIVIKRLLENRRRRLKNQNKKEKAQMSSFENLKQKYPAHFLLFNLVDEVSEKLKNDPKIEKEVLFYTPSFTYFNKRIKNKNDINENSDRPTRGSVSDGS